MKHITYADKSLLVGDEAADTLLAYARVLAETNSADTVTLRTIGEDGNTVDASLLLTPSTVMMVETTNTVAEVPDNDAAIREMKRRIAGITRPVQAEPPPPWNGLGEFL